RRPSRRCWTGTSTPSPAITRRWRSRFCARPAGCLSYVRLLLRLGLRLVVGRGVRGRGPVEQLDERHRRGVALAEAELQDPQVAPRARLVARAELVEELADDVTVAQAVEREPPVGERRLLGERDQRLGDAAQLLRLRQRRLDRLVREQ